MIISLQYSRSSKSELSNCGTLKCLNLNGSDFECLGPTYLKKENGRHFVPFSNGLRQNGLRLILFLNVGPKSEPFEIKTNVHCSELVDCTWLYFDSGNIGLDIGLSYSLW